MLLNVVRTITWIYIGLITVICIVIPLFERHGVITSHVVVVVYLHDITTYINIREISQMNHANKDLKEVKNL